MQVQLHTIHWQVCSPVFWVSLTIFFSIMLWLIITWVFKAVVLTNAFKKKVYLLIGITFKKNFMDPFLWMGFKTTSRLEPLWGGSLLFTTKFSEIPGTHFIDLRRMKGWVDLGPTQWFWTQDPFVSADQVLLLYLPGLLPNWEKLLPSKTLR